MFKKIMASLSAFMLLATSNAYASENSVLITSKNANVDTIGDFFSQAIQLITPIAWQLGGFIIFIAVVKVGFDVVKHRKNEDKRKEALNSILWLAVGAFIIGSAVIIASVIWNSVQIS